MRINSPFRSGDRVRESTGINRRWGIVIDSKPQYYVRGQNAYQAVEVEFDAEIDASTVRLSSAIRPWISFEPPTRLSGE